MTSTRKVVIGVCAVRVAALGVYASTVYSKKGVVTVQSSKVVRMDLTSVVTASGEIKPKNYINIGANAPGELKVIPVKEGEHVRKGQLLAKIEDIQPVADVDAQQATLAAAVADANASEAGLRASDENIQMLQAAITQSQAELARTKADYDRSQAQFNEQLLARQDFDTRKFAYDAQKAAVQQADVRLSQAKAQREQAAANMASSQKRIAQAKANLARFTDVLDKRSSYAPIDGVVTNLPVRAGENVVPGLQNQAGTLIMTIADMSQITAEVKVDETDIVNVKVGQVAEITIDAIPNRTFKGHVTEIGNTAILRSTGLAASQSAISSQEAKDFKVVVAMDNPPDEIRPGLSCSTKITTATRQNVLSIPIQALTVRQKGDLEPESSVKSSSTAATPTPAAEKARKEELQGVFVVSGGRVMFHKVDTGITGTTDIEVLDGLKEGDEVVTGTYQTIRTIRNEAQVKVDNSTATQQKS